MAVLENPVSVLFCEPKSIILHAGIFVREINPPAAPISLAAVEAPDHY